MQEQKIEEIFSRFKESNPNPKTELTFINEYTLLVAIVLSAQATDVSVNKATKSLFEEVKTPESMVNLGEEKLKTYIKSIGLYNAKAKNVILLSKKLIEEFNSKVPANYNDLKSLPGVGSKTAKVLLNCAFEHPTIAVDTHVFRVSNRIGLTSAKNALKAELQLEAIVPDRWKNYTHHWLILHGRYICKARKPECVKCRINDLCEYDSKNL
ncbi:MAG: endonuclease III [Alphaproteobacteria bacterium]